MTNNLWAAGLSLLAAAAVSAQTATAPPSFDVASVKASPAAPAGPGGGGGMRARAGRGGSVQTSPDGVTMRNTTLKNAIRWAYHVSEFQVVGPDWLDSARFNIVAKSSSPAGEEQLQAMTQTLLADRFKLTLHRQSKEFQVYVLEQGKNGTKLQESDSQGDSVIDTQSDRMNVVVRRTPVSQMIDVLTPVLGAPVIDMTGLKGKYDLNISLAEFMSEPLPGGAPMDPLSIVTAALDRKLGLKIEPRKMPLDILMVDHAEKLPTEN